MAAVHKESVLRPPAAPIRSVPWNTFPADISAATHENGRNTDVARIGYVTPIATIGDGRAPYY